MPAVKTVVLASYVPGEGHLESRRHQVRPILCFDDLDYSLGIASWWDEPVVIVNVEHDLQVTDEQIAEIIVCSEPLCSWRYPMHWISTGNPSDVHPHTVDHGKPSERFVTEDEEWADWSAIGFVKIAPSARTSPLRICHWREVEAVIDEAVTGRWHLHGPAVPHHHW